MIWLSIAALLAVSLPLGYLYLILAGAARRGLRHTHAKRSDQDRLKPPLQERTEAPRFAVAIPAHDERGVIRQTVEALRRMDYPVERLDVYVVADHCSDDTAELARRAGATCLERKDGPRGGKGAALSWLLDKIWETGVPYDAVVIFDADTQVDPGFLWAMASRLALGEQVVQGRHRIRNPQDGWYPALSDAMFRLNNRVFNQGRANLGLSAMHMGDSICLRSDLLRRTGWGEGLTEDYDLRLRLLMEGVRIAYEPSAIGAGEAPATWANAARQRQRWLAGTYGSARRRLREVVRMGVKRRDPALLDAAAQMVLPSYSTLTVIGVAALAAQLAIKAVWPASLPWGALAAWAAALGLLALFPLLGLALDRAPGRAYAAVALGPFFVVWRTWLAVRARYLRRPTDWVRTPRRGMDRRQDLQD